MRVTNADAVGGGFFGARYVFGTFLLVFFFSTLFSPWYALSSSPPFFFSSFFSSEIRSLGAEWIELCLDGLGNGWNQLWAWDLRTWYGSRGNGVRMSLINGLKGGFGIC